MKEFENNHDQEQAGFGMPKDYFQSSADALINRMEWLEEHREFPALKMAWRKNVFARPENYFEHTATLLENTPYQTLMRLRGQLPFISPDAYFENDLSDVISTLSNLPKEQAFAVPEQYFEQSALTLASTLTEKKEAKIISLNRRMWQFAAAAVLILCASWFTYQYYLTPVVEQDCGGIACVDRREILQTKSLELLDEDELQTIVNVKQLEDALNRPQAKPSATNDTAISEEDLLDNL